MSSQNKKNKGKNSCTYADKAIKDTHKMKRLNFYNSATRQKNKQFKLESE